MKTISTSNFSRNYWLKKPVSAKSFQLWLLDTGSLTLRLQQRYSQFSVRPLCVHDEVPLKDEASMLHLHSDQYALIRDVLLLGNQRAVVYAHSVLPHTSLRGAWRGLGKLGNKPLGAMLFANSKVKRTPLSYKKLMPNHCLFRRACLHLNERPAYLWARRSVFSLNCANILVTEVFLPELLRK